MPDRKNSRRALIIGSVVVASLFLGGAALAMGGPAKKKAGKKVDPIGPVDPDPVDPKVDVPKSGDALEFDLSNNWGGLPMSLRVWLARGELASGIPGFARALGVKWWQAFRAMKALVSPEEAAAIAAANPELGRFLINKGDAAAAKKGLDNAIKNGWPKPKDYVTFASGSWGLGDILGSNFPYAGILTDGKKALAYLNRDGKTLMQSYEGQLGAAISEIRNIIVAPKYSVLASGINAKNGDSLQTWGNVFAAYAYPDAYSKGAQLAIDAKTRYMQRALEIGIDLAKVAYPWPPGQVFKHPPWSFAAVVKRLKEFASRPVHDTGGTDEVLDAEDEPAPAEDKPAPAEDDPPAEDKPEAGFENIPVDGDMLASVYTAGVLAGADNVEAPLVILLHGRHASAGQLEAYVDLKKPVRYAFLRGPQDGGPGSAFSWFGGNEPHDQQGPAIIAAADKIEAAGKILLKRYKTKGIYVVGYSQGAAIAYRLIAKLGLTGGLIIAGYLPKELGPTNPIASHLYACHGTNDAAVSFDRGKAAFDLFVPYTNSPVWTPVAGGDHGLASLKPTIQLLMEAMLP